MKNTIFEIYKEKQLNQESLYRLIKLIVRLTVESKEIGPTYMNVNTTCLTNRCVGEYFEIGFNLLSKGMPPPLTDLFLDWHFHQTINEHAGNNQILFEMLVAKLSFPVIFQADIKGLLLFIGLCTSREVEVECQNEISKYLDAYFNEQS